MTEIQNSPPAVFAGALTGLADGLADDFAGGHPGAGAGAGMIATGQTKQSENASAVSPACAAGFLPPRGGLSGEGKPLAGEKCEAGVLASLTPERWTKVNQELIAKILSELLFEDIIDPPLEEGPDGTVLFHFAVSDTVEYQFSGRVRMLGNWRVDPASVVRVEDGVVAPPGDMMDMVADLMPALDVNPSIAANALHELANTVLADVQVATGPSAAALANEHGPRLESAMQGHPWIVANKGRLGFGYEDSLRYAPEQERMMRLPWLAVARETAVFRATRGLDHARLLREELDDQTLARFGAVLQDRGRSFQDVWLFPVHPWQWGQRTVPLFAGAIARGELIPLGEGPDDYLPGQSIRTFSNMSRAAGRIVKLPISILNTSVYRGIPSTRAQAAPELTQWLLDNLATDTFLRDECGLVLLGEVASVTVEHRAYAALPDVPYQFTETLGAIWREPVQPFLAPGEKAVTLAALLHRDPEGVPWLRPVIERSGCTVAAWTEACVAAILPPLLHVLYKYGTVFSPHGQNCLLIMRDNIPVRLVVKDFVDDLTVSSDPIPELSGLSEELRDLLESMEAPILLQWIQAGLFLGVFRYLSEILLDDFDLAEREFWAITLRIVRRYQEQHAELSERFAYFDLETPVFVKLCLNRVRLYDRGYADDAERPVAATSGFVANPLYLVGAGATPSVTPHAGQPVGHESDDLSGILRADLQGTPGKELPVDKDF